MNIVITGATGFVGRMIVPRLLNMGCRLLLVGRSIDHLKEIFPSCDCCDYFSLAENSQDFDLLVHLATVNNNSNLPPQMFRQVNVDFLIYVIDIAKAAGIPYFLNVSSIHVQDIGNLSPYAVSKRDALTMLESVTGINVSTVYLPLVYGDSWSGKLSFLNKLPTPVANAVFLLLSTLKPTVHVDRFVDYIAEELFHRSIPQKTLTDRQRNNPLFWAAKRCFDLLFAVTTILFFWWLFMLIWIGVKTTSKGPGIFAQQRIGRFGREFVCYKFRTMAANTRQAGTHEVSKASVTNFGSFLRKAKLDELPQVWNIIKGELSLVGPRPSLTIQHDLVNERKKRGVLEVRPGITGLAQVNGIDMSNPQKLAWWDERYLTDLTILTDLKIVLATFIGQGSGDRVKK